MLGLVTMRRWSVEHSAPHKNLDPYILPIPSTDNYVNHGMPVLGVSIHPLSLIAGKKTKTVLVINSSRSAQAWSKRPLLLQWPILCLPRTSSQEALSEPTCIEITKHNKHVSFWDSSRVKILWFMQTTDFWYTHVISTYVTHQTHSICCFWAVGAISSDTTVSHFKQLTITCAYSWWLFHLL